MVLKNSVGFVTLTPKSYFWLYNVIYSTIARMMVGVVGRLGIEDEVVGQAREELASCHIQLLKMFEYFFRYNYLALCLCLEQ